MMNLTTLLKGMALVALIALLQLQALSQVQAEWRGADRRGIYPGAGNLASWPETGPAMRWSTEVIGDGYGSPVFLDDKMYICGTIDSTAFLFEFDLAGKMLRKVPYGKDWTVNYVGSRNAPTIADGLIYVSTGLGDLVCIDRNTFTEKWRIDGRTGLHNTLPLFGHAESPAVEGNRVFFNPGGKDTNVVALDRFTGKIEWVCAGDGERPGYNSALVIPLASRSVLVTFSAYSLMGIDTRDGKLLWTHPQVNIPLAERKPGNGDTHSNTVWFDNGAIYYIAGDGNGAVRLILSPDGSSIKQVWRNPSIDNYMGGFIKLGNTIFSGSDSKKSLYSINITTGEIADTLKCGIGALISDGQMLYYYNQRGEMNLIRPVTTGLYLGGQGTSGMELAGKFRITMGTKEHFAHPVIYRGVLYVRHGKALMAYDIKGK